MCLCFPACLFPAFRHFFVKMTASLLLWMTEWRHVQLLHISSAAKRCKQNSYHQSQTFTNLRPDLFGRVNAYWVVQSPSGVFFLQQTYFPEMNFNCKFTAGFNQWNVYISTQYTSRARSSAYCEKQKKLCLTSNQAVHWISRLFIHPCGSYLTYTAVVADMLNTASRIWASSSPFPNETLYLPWQVLSLEVKQSICQ